jgi:hypothetical protein
MFTGITHYDYWREVRAMSADIVRGLVDERSELVASDRDINAFWFDCSEERSERIRYMIGLRLESHPWCIGGHGLDILRHSASVNAMHEQDGPVDYANDVWSAVNQYARFAFAYDIFEAAMERWETLPPFRTAYDAYVECLLWSNGYVVDCEGRETDVRYEDYCLSNSAAVSSFVDVLLFTIRAIDVAESLGYSIELFLDVWPAFRIGHDFALTRNGHGAGFWDRYSSMSDCPKNREAAKLGIELSHLCKSFSSVDIWLCEDTEVVSIY